ncbi:MAG: TIGR03067 domain-containing protein [Planctomycetia bacterium]|nr:TIGR03067 domain-containing protein [Planctomycetia bacterium]
MTDDQARMQGTWLVEKFEILPEDEIPPPDELKQVSGIVKGNVITIEFEGKEHKEHAVFALDVNKSPKWIDVTEANAKGEVAPPKKVGVTHKSGKIEYREQAPEKMLGIYKFDGDKLVLAFGPDGAPRPTEFKAVPRRKDVDEKDSGLVVVVYLKKK